MVYSSKLLERISKVTLTEIMLLGKRTFQAINQSSFAWVDGFSCLWNGNASSKVLKNIPWKMSYAT